MATYFQLALHGTSLEQLKQGSLNYRKVLLLPRGTGELRIYVVSRKCLQQVMTQEQANDVTIEL